MLTGLFGWNVFGRFESVGCLGRCCCLLSVLVIFTCKGVLHV